MSAPAEETPTPPRTGEDDHPDIIVGGDLSGDATQQLPAFVGDGVSSLGPVERDGRDAVLSFKEDVGCHVIIISRGCFVGGFNGGMSYVLGGVSQSLSNRQVILKA